MTAPMTKAERHTMRSKARKAFLHTVFTTAMEGGIGYWSVADAYRWSKPENYTKVIDGISFHGSHDVDDTDNFYAILSSSEGDWGIASAYQPGNKIVDPRPGVSWSPYVELGRHDDEKLRVDIDIVERGVNLLVDKVIEATKSEDPNAPFSNKYLRQFVEAWLTDGDCGDYDADGADLAIQLGLFGEVVYA